MPKKVVALLALPESTASTLYGMFDVLESAGRDWSMLIEGSPAESALRTVIVSADGKARPIGNGLWMQPHASLAECAEPDVIAIPDLMVPPHDDIAGRYPAEVDWLKRQYAAIANDVGYEDASFFGRLFRRKVGLTPAQYRKRFQSLRAALAADRTVPTSGFRSTRFTSGHG